MLGSNMLTWSFILLYLVAATLGQSVYFQDTSCIIIYSLISNSSQGSNLITFHNCTTSQFSSPIWDHCLNQCCQGNTATLYPSPSYSAFKHCQQNNTDRQNIKVIRIIVGLVVGMFLSFIVTCIVCHHCNRHGRSRVDKYSSPEVVSRQWTNSDHINDGSSKQIIWSEIANKDSPLKENNQPCTICLEEFTSAQLFCSHQYHPVCIGGWLSKNAVCPCCRHWGINLIRIYCSTCRWQYYVCTKQFLCQKYNHLPLRCKQCRKEQQNFISTSKIQLEEAYQNKLSKYEVKMTKEQIVQ